MAQVRAHTSVVESWTRHPKEVDRGFLSPPDLEYGGAHTSPGADTPATATRSSLVSKEMRLFTRYGCPRIADIVGNTVEAWSGNPSGGWVRVSPRVSGETAVDLYRVKLDDGRCLTCAGDHPWAVVSSEARIIPVLTRHLRTDFAISPFVLFPASELEGVDDPHAYELGSVYGIKMSQKCRFKDGLPAHIFGLDPPSLANFVAGWLDAQKGILFGCKEAIHDLQIVLHRLGVYHTFRDDRGQFCSLALSEKDAGNIPNPRGMPREYRRIASNLPRIVEVCSLGDKQRPYTLAIEGAHTIVIDGVIALC